MNRDVIERLLTDEALGALDPDVAGLLAEHLRDDAWAQARREELRKTIASARNAMDASDAVTVPPFPREALLAADESTHRRAFAWPARRLQWPLRSSPSRLANMAAASKRGRHSQSMLPSRCTSAALWVEPMRA